MILGDKANDEVCLQGWNQQFLLLPMKLVIEACNCHPNKSKPKVKKKSRWSTEKFNFSKI
jgi:hypothetical protein